MRLQVLATPGHTPESICITAYESPEAVEPTCVFTGDTLFIGDVGRPDLLASVGHTAEDLGRMLYRSLREKVMPLPDAVKVYPAHGAGSACGKNLSTETMSTMGEQRALNYALQPMSEDAFVAMVTEGQPAAPGYFVYDAIKNRKDRDLLDENRTGAGPLAGRRRRSRRRWCCRHRHPAGCRLRRGSPGGCAQRRTRRPLRGVRRVSGGAGHPHGPGV